VTDVSAAASCAGEQLLRQAAAEQPPTTESQALLQRAVPYFRKAADTTHDVATKKRALEQLELIFDEHHLDAPRDADPVLRELIALQPGDLESILRLAKLQERQELFDAAEQTLLAAHQRAPADVAPYQALAQFFASRAAALSEEADRQRRANVVPGASEPGTRDAPDKDGIYSLGGAVVPPRQISAIVMPVTPEIAAAGITGSVSLEVVIDETGSVADAHLVRPAPLLENTAVATVRQWRFEPATLDGKPVPVRMNVVLNVRQ